MNHFLILGLGVLLLVVLLYFEKMGPPLGRIVTKSLLSLLFVITVFLQFISKAFSNRLIGLPLYYTGQFLLAFSPGFF